MKWPRWISYGVLLALALGGIAPVPAAEQMKSAPPAANDLRLDGISQSARSFVVFVTQRGEDSPRQLEALGARVGPWTLVAVDAAKGHADFRREGGDPVRVWLRDAALREDDEVGPGGQVAVPALHTLQGLVGLAEAVAALPRTAEMKTKITLAKIINQEGLPVAERLKRLADLRSGARRHIIVPTNGVDAAFAAKYGLTSGEVARANNQSLDSELVQEHPTPQTSYERQ